MTDEAQYAQGLAAGLGNINSGGAKPAMPATEMAITNINVSIDKVDSALIDLVHKLKPVLPANEQVQCDIGPPQPPSFGESPLAEQLSIINNRALSLMSRIHSIIGTLEV